MRSSGLLWLLGIGAVVLYLAHQSSGASPFGHQDSGQSDMIPLPPTAWDASTAFMLHPGIGP